MVVDEQINFNAVRFEEQLYHHFRWMGYISFPHTSIFDFDATGIEGRFKLMVGDELVCDTDKETALGSFRAVENILYEIKVEYSLVST